MQALMAVQQLRQLMRKMRKRAVVSRMTQLCSTTTMERVVAVVVLVAGAGVVMQWAVIGRRVWIAAAVRTMT
jgi:hypothetical protein